MQVRYSKLRSLVKSFNIVNMRIKFLGAAGTVTGSSMMLTSQSNESILIDCGMFQGTPEVASLNRQAFEINPNELLSVILTHAHLDHCGRLPLLIKNGFNKDIWMTPPTSDITEISLYDTAKIAHSNPGEPIYTSNDVDPTISLFKTQDYDHEFSVGPFKITFKNAGHIIGSACVEIIDSSAQNEFKKIVFSGDLGNSPEALIEPTETITSGDIVVMESTYGDRFHPVTRPQDLIEAEINKIEASGGVLLIPAFSIERSQEILHIISHLKSSGKVKNQTEVVFDGPMGEKVTAVFEKYKNYFNKELTDDMSRSDPFKFPGLNEIKNFEDSQHEVVEFGPKVVIAGSGMMSGGRILEYAAKFLPVPSTQLLFVGYQALGTIGRKILGGHKEIYIKGQKVMVNAQINEIQSMSSHADQKGLLAWLSTIKGTKKVILDHGEDPTRSIFAAKITEKLGINDITIPMLNEEIVI